MVNAQRCPRGRAAAQAAETRLDSLPPFEVKCEGPYNQAGEHRADGEMMIAADDKSGGRQVHHVSTPSSAAGMVLDKMAATEAGLLDRLEGFERHLTELLAALEPNSCPQRERPPRSW